MSPAVALPAQAFCLQAVIAAIAVRVTVRMIGADDSQPIGLLISAGATIAGVIVLSAALFTGKTSSATRKLTWVMIVIGLLSHIAWVSEAVEHS